MAEFSSEAALAKVKAFIQASVHDRDDAAVRELVTKASAEQGSFSPPADAGEMQIDMGEPAQDGAEWVVPVTITNPNDSNQPVIKTPFTLTEEDGQYKINMIRTMDRMFGGDVNGLMDGMVDALKGVGEAMADGMKQAFDGLGEAMGQATGQAFGQATGQSTGQSTGQATGQAFDPSEYEKFNRLPDGAPSELIDLFNRFHDINLPDQIALMREAMGNEQFAFFVDWDSFYGDFESASKLKNKVLHNVRSAICLSCSDDATRDLMREHLREVVVRHVAYPEGKQIRILNGCMEITTNLNDVGPGVGYHQSSEIIAAIREGLDLDKGPAIERLMSEVIPQLKEELRERLELDLNIDIDLASFTEAYDSDVAVRHLEQLERDLFRNFVYFIRAVNSQVPLANLLEGFRIEHVGSPVDRLLLARGRTIIVRVNFTGDNGSFSATDLEAILPGVAASLPDFSDPRSQMDSGNSDMMDQSVDAFAILAGYRDDHLPQLSNALQEAIGRSLEIEVDWASVGENSIAADQLIYWGLNRVIGAVRLIRRDQLAQEDMMEAISAVRITCVESADQKEIDLSDGVLTLRLRLADGEAGCFYECDIAEKIISSMGSQWKPIIEEIRRQTQYWEEQLASPEHDAPATYAIDFAGFTSVADDHKVRFALTQLREHGIDVIYYAITRLLESNPNFKQQFQKRVRRLLINHVPDSSQKSLSCYDDALVYQTALHNGYKGYLTIDDMVKRLPGLVAAMTDISDEETMTDETGDSTQTTQGETDELNRMAQYEDEITENQGTTDEVEDNTNGNAEAFAQVRRDMEPTLTSFTQQFASMIGKPIPLSIDWDSLNQDPVAVGMLLNVCLSPIMAGFIDLSQNSSYREDAAKYIQEIVLARAEATDMQAMSLHDGVLKLTLFLDPQNPMPLPTEDAPAIFRGLIDYVRASGTEPAKPSTKKKAAPKKAKAIPKKASPKTKPAAKTKSSLAKPTKKKGKGGK